MSDVTVYFQYKQQDSSGKECTRKFAKEFYEVILPSLETVPLVADALQAYSLPILNIAGNRLSKFDWVPQSLLNVWVLNYVEAVAKEVRGELHIVSGGQTGADWAGIVAAAKLELPCVATFPKNWRQENAETQSLESLQQRLHDDLIKMQRLIM